MAESASAFSPTRQNLLIDKIYRQLNSKWHLNRYPAAPPCNENEQCRKIPQCLRNLNSQIKIWLQCSCCILKHLVQHRRHHDSVHQKEEDFITKPINEYGSSQGKQSNLQNRKVVADFGDVNYEVASTQLTVADEYELRKPEEHENAQIPRRLGLHCGVKILF